MRVWIARDRDNTLCLFNLEPINHADYSWVPRTKSDCGNYLNLPESEFPEITWENSPKEIEINVGSM